MPASIEFLDAIIPETEGCFIEVRFLHPQKKPMVFFCPSIEALSEKWSEIERISQTMNVYFGVCPRIKEAGDKTAVKQVWCLWVDLDSKDFIGGKDEALGRLKDFPFQPTAIIDSGHGQHAYWRFKEAFCIETPEDVLKIEGYLKGVAKSLGGDLQAAEIARILRLPGTMNHKFESVSVNIVELDEARQYNLSDFDDFLCLETEQVAIPERKNEQGWIVEALKGLKVGNRNGTFTKLTGKLHQGKISPDEIYSLLEPHAVSVEFPAQELHSLIDGVCKRYPNNVPDEKKIEIDPPMPLIELLKMDIPQVAFFAADLLPKQGKSLISAAPNVGKSIFVQHLALVLASGSKFFLNKFAILPAKVLYLDLEMGVAPLHERFQKMSKRGGFSVENLYVKHIPDLDLRAEPWQKVIESWIFDKKIDVLILDPLGNAWGGKENAQEEVRKLTGYINTLISKYRVSVLAVHHWRKATKDAKTGGQMAAGSYVWEAWTDCHVCLQGGVATGITVSCEKNRYRPRFTPFLTKVDPDSLLFDFSGDFVKKYGDDALVTLFDSFGQDTVGVPAIIQRAKDQGGPSETTVRDLIEKSKLFEVDKSKKTHFIKRKQQTGNQVEVLSWED